LGWRQRDPAGNDPNRSRDDRQKLYHPRRSKGAKGPYWDDPKRAGTARLGRCHFLSLSIARLKLLPLWLPPGGVKGPSRDDPGTPLTNLWEEGQGTAQRRAAPPASAKCSSSHPLGRSPAVWERAATRLAPMGLMGPRLKLPAPTAISFWVEQELGEALQTSLTSSLLEGFSRSHQDSLE